MDIEKNYVRDNFLNSGLKGTEKDYSDLLSSLPIKGMGNPVSVKKTGKILKVRIDNPYNEAFLSGMIAGYYEAIEKIEANTKWTQNTEGYITITINNKK